MKISTKGRYALRVMIDLAQNSNEKYTSLKDIAKSIWRKNVKKRP